MSRLPLIVQFFVKLLSKLTENWLHWFFLLDHVFFTNRLFRELSENSVAVSKKLRMSSTGI